MSEEPTSPQVVYAYYTVEEAELSRAHLESAGISAIVEGKHAAGVLPLHALALGGIRLVVQAKDLAAARALLGIDAREEAEPERKTDHTDEGDGWMRRAALAGFLGLTVCPGVGAAYASVLLMRYGSLRLSPRGRLHRGLAVACCVTTLLVLVIWRLRA